MKSFTIITVWMSTFTVLLVYFFSTFRNVEPLPENALLAIFGSAFIFSIPATLIIGIIVMGLKKSR